MLVALAALFPAFGTGLYNWYGGYNTVAATGVNGWNWAPVNSTWSWGTGAYVSAYTNTYPYLDYHTAAGWAGASASAFSSAPGRSASASASGYNAGYPWWNSGGYFNAIATTSGAPSYATANGRPMSTWTYYYNVPLAYWNAWVIPNGAFVPLSLGWWYWGWFDPPMSDMLLNIELNVDDLNGNSLFTLQDGVGTSAVVATNSLAAS